MQLLERHGVLTREAVLAEGVTGGYAGLYPMLRALEDQGHVRRGYFVEGLGAAQFALPGAVDRLRRESKPMSAVALGAADPAQPFGATLAWPESAGRPARAAGALVVLHDGEPLVHIERGGKSMSSFANAAISSAWAPALAEAARAGRVRFELATIDGERAAASPLVEHLEGAGFVRGYRGWTLPV